jgi:hypothetical protein
VTAGKSDAGNSVNGNNQHGRQKTGHAEKQKFQTHKSSLRQAQDFQRKLNAPLLFAADGLRRRGTALALQEEKDNEEQAAERDTRKKSRETVQRVTYD